MIRFMDGRSSGRILKNIIISLVIGGIVSLAFLGGLFETLELLTVDLRIKNYPSQGYAPVAFVVIDQNSLKSLAAWPFPRSYYARVIERLTEDGARAVLLDLDLSTPGPVKNEDRQLVESAKNSLRVVMAVQMEERTNPEGALIRNVSLPFPELADSALAVGGIAFDVDPDGVIRRMPRSINLIDKIYYPMGVVGARIIDPVTPFQFPEGAMINYSYERLSSQPVVPFNKLLEGQFPEGSFTDRIVLVGATSIDLHDFWMTPSGVMPGVFIQAAVLETALNHSWYQRQGPLSAILVVMLVSMLLGVLVSGLGWRGAITVTVLHIGIVSASAIMLASGQYLLQTVPLIIIAIVLVPLQTVLKVGGAEKKLHQERERTEVILKLSELTMAEDAGRDTYMAPLVLLRQALGLDRILLFTSAEDKDPPWIIEDVFTDGRQLPAYKLERVIDCLEEGECLTDRLERISTYVPMMTARRRLGVMYTENPLDRPLGKEGLRLLLSFATQTAYFLETVELDNRVKSLYQNSIKAISRALDSKDRFTAEHSEFAVEYVDRYGNACGLKREDIESLHVGALLHDIGKIGVPDNILKKVGTLTGDEYEAVKKHPGLGYDIVKDMPFPTGIKNIILHHHEMYDGSGYPDGLKGEEIPLIVRIFSIMDAYESLVGKRPYRDPLDTGAALEMMKKASGRQFDPDLLDKFISCFGYDPRLS